MLIDEVFEYHNSSWSEVARELGIGVNTYLNWRKIGYIPYATQRRIQITTGSALKANHEHAKPQPGFVKKDVKSQAEK